MDTIVGAHTFRERFEAWPAEIRFDYHQYRDAIVNRPASPPTRRGRRGADGSTAAEGPPIDAFRGAASQISTGGMAPPGLTACRRSTAPDDGMTSVHAGEGDVLVLRLDEGDEDFAGRAPSNTRDPSVDRL
jgi:hypothetical protein